MNSNLLLFSQATFCRDRSFLFPRNAWGSRKSRSGFSLIEVVLAIGVLSFSFLVLFNMIPVGLGMMSGSMDATIGMQIVQRVTTDARQAKFSELTPVCKLDRNPGTDARGEKADFFFDDQGNEVDADAVSKKNFVYTAAVVLLKESAVPGRTGAQVPNPDVATVKQLPTTNFATINIIIRKNESSEVLRVVNVLIANNGL
ncbi:MAG: Verru_Chthon cassette protein B [Chthoniobacter sp.]|nr:Verru_Chthon cassette protein B [Chthoniobacter sp.]